jgi:hypothetical protein
LIPVRKQPGLKAPAFSPALLVPVATTRTNGLTNREQWPFFHQWKKKATAGLIGDGDTAPSSAKARKENLGEGVQILGFSQPRLPASGGGDEEANLRRECAGLRVPTVMGGLERGCGGRQQVR